jgi:hypothetical protein
VEYPLSDIDIRKLIIDAPETDRPLELSSPIVIQWMFKELDWDYDFLYTYRKKILIAGTVQLLKINILLKNTTLLASDAVEFELQAPEEPEDQDVAEDRELENYTKFSQLSEAGEIEDVITAHLPLSVKHIMCSAENILCLELYAPYPIINYVGGIVISGSEFQICNAGLIPSLAGLREIWCHDGLGICGVKFPTLRKIVWKYRGIRDDLSDLFICDHADTLFSASLYGEQSFPYISDSMVDAYIDGSILPLSCVPNLTHLRTNYISNDVDFSNYPKLVDVEYERIERGLKLPPRLKFTQMRDLTSETFDERTTSPRTKSR